jgi:hypothetical protein
MSQRQQIIKKYFDQSTTTKDFQKGQLVLLWNKAKENPSMHIKFEELWIGPYIIENILGYNSYLLKYMKGTIQVFQSMANISRVYLPDYSCSHLYIVLFPFLLYIFSFVIISLFTLTPCPIDQILVLNNP